MKSAHYLHYRQIMQPAFLFFLAQMRHLVIIVISFLLAVSAGSQIIPENRRVYWDNAGTDFDFSVPVPLVNVKNYGALGNGNTNDYASMLLAINALNGIRGIVFLPPGNYLLSSTLNLPDSVSLMGSGAALTTISSTVGENKHIISVGGSATTDFIDVSAGFFKNSLQLTLANPGSFFPGDCVEIIQDGHLHMTSGWAMNTLGQILVIDSVDGLQIYLREPLRMNYTESLHPRIRKIFPRTAVSIGCMKLERLVATTSQTSNIAFTFAYNCLVEGVESNLCNFSHIDISKSTNITVRNSYFHHGHSYGSGGKAYGVCIQATSGSCLIENNIFRQLRHSMLLQAGSNGNVFACNYSLSPYWTDVALPSNSAGDIVLHGNYPYLNLFEGNIVQQIVIDDSHGKNGHHNTFFRNRAELYGIFMNNNPPTDSVNFVGNEVTNNGFFMGLYLLYGVNHFQYGNNIRGTIQPAGTGTLTDTSYFYEQNPSFWNFSEPFPPIGPPSAINAYTIPAKARYLSGNNVAFCPEIILNIFASAGIGGTIEPAGDIPVNLGGSQLFSIVPEAGYSIMDVLVDGVNKGAVQQYEFTDVSNNHSIHASFATAPVVVTAPVTEITSSSARSGGSVLSDGGAEITARGILWSRFHDPTFSNYEGLTVDGSGAGNYTSQLTGLSYQTTYYVRAYANNYISASYGQEEEFTTPLASELLLSNMVLPSNSDTCFAAAFTIITAGDGEIFLVSENAITMLVAGQNILLKSGTIVDEGAHLVARISQDSTFCLNQANIFNHSENENPDKLLHDNKKYDNTSYCIYPNPCSGKLVVEITGENKLSDMVFEIFSIGGKQLLRKELSAQKFHYFCLSEYEAGLYLIRIIYGNETAISKLIIQ